MEKSLFEQMGGDYHQEGDYFIPNLILTKGHPYQHLGATTAARSSQTPSSIYTARFLSGKLDAYLAEIDQQAEEMFSQLVIQMAEQESITEQRKAGSQMERGWRMNNIRQRAEEIINAELIYS